MITTAQGGAFHADSKVQGRTHFGAFALFGAFLISIACRSHRSRRGLSNVFRVSWCRLVVVGITLRSLARFTGESRPGPGEFNVMPAMTTAITPRTPQANGPQPDR